MTIDGINFGIRYLQTLSQLMQEAIDNGVALERAVATSKMPEYENYSLYACYGAEGSRSLIETRRSWVLCSIFWKPGAPGSW